MKSFVKWYTLIELLIVMVIIWIVSAIAFSIQSKPSNWNKVGLELKSVFNKNIHKNAEWKLYIEVPLEWCDWNDYANCNLVNGCIEKVLPCSDKWKECRGLTSPQDYQFWNLLNKLQGQEKKEVLENLISYKVCPRIIGWNINKNYAFEWALENPSFTYSFVNKQGNFVTTFNWSFK